jgi:hypothetical protein
VIAYYPPHEAMLWWLLRRIRYQPDAASSTLPFCVLGAGPAPEVHALNRYLASISSKVKTIEALLVDHHTPNWQPIREAAITVMNRRGSELLVQCTPIQADLTDPDWLDRCREVLLGVRLLVMQNVINEIAEARWDEFVGGFRAVLSALPSGACVIVAHVTKRARLADLERAVEDLLDVKWPTNEAQPVQLSARSAETLDDLFWRLHPKEARRYMLRIQFFAGRRRATHAPFAH